MYIVIMKSQTRDDKGPFDLWRSLLSFENTNKDTAKIDMEANIKNQNKVFDKRRDPSLPLTCKLQKVL